MKNKFMRIAAVMLMLCLVTTCAISGTFAKYTTEATGEDTARVAYWGFTGENADIALTDLFKDTYSTDVKGAVDVIAPGTTNSATFVFKYTDKSTTVDAPEVAYQITVSTDGSECADAIKQNPNIVWKLGSTTFETTTDAGGTTYAFDKLLAAIEALAGNAANGNTATAGVASYGPSADYLPDITTEQTITWEWIFDQAAGGEDYDTGDTAMGNNPADLEVTIKITVNAVQTNA